MYLLKLDMHTPLKFLPWMEDYSHPWTDKDYCEFFGKLGMSKECQEWMCREVDDYRIKDFIDYEKFDEHKSVGKPEKKSTKEIISTDEDDEPKESTSDIFSKYTSEEILKAVKEYSDDPDKLKSIYKKLYDIYDETEKRNDVSDGEMRIAFIEWLKEKYTEEEIDDVESE